MKLLNKDKLSELCKQNVLQFLQAFLRKIPTSTFLSISDIECSYSGLASSYSNSIVGGNLYDSDFEGKAMKAISFFASKGASTTWWMKQSENIDDTVKKMYSFGFQDLVQLKGMALELKSCKEISIDLPNFSIAIVDSDSSFEDYTSIYANFLAPEYHKDIFEYYKLVASLKAYDTINTMYFVGYLEKNRYVLDVYV